MTESTRPKPYALSRGHKKRARTHQSLIDAATRIYARTGVGGLTMNDLAEEAGLASGTIYNYFRSREEVLAAVGIAMAIRFSEDILSQSQDITDGAHRLVIAVRTCILRAGDEGEWAKAVLSVIQIDAGLRSALVHYAGHDLRLGMEQGLFEIKDLEAAVDCVTSFGLAAIRSRVEGRANAGYDIVTVEMLLKALGMSAAKARKYACLPLPERASADAFLMKSETVT